MIDFESEFTKSQGQPIAIAGKKYYMYYSFHVPKETLVKIIFISAISTPRQGVRIDADKTIKCLGRETNSLNIWHSPDKEEHEIAVFCPEETSFNLRNIWDNGDGVVQSWHGGGAMMVSQDGNKFIINCNSTLSDDRCRDCIFEVSI